MMTKHRLRHHRGQDRHWIRKTCRLDHQPAKWPNLASLTSRVKVAHRPAQIAPDGATKATALQQHDLVVEPTQQVVIETDFAELVDKDRRIPKSGRSKQPLQQRRLAAA
jgi:hypothetical protein